MAASAMVARTLTARLRERWRRLRCWLTGTCHVCERWPRVAKGGGCRQTTAPGRARLIVADVYACLAAHLGTCRDCAKLSVYAGQWQANYEALRNYREENKHVVGLEDC